MTVYPPNLKIIFRPTVELDCYRGYGINTREQREWVIPRDKAKIILASYPNNFRPELTYPSDEALVSAVMCTCEGREKMVERAVKQFISQTYLHKELIIVNQGTEWITNGEVPGVTEVRVHETLTNGAMHNIGDGISDGSYIIRWDDDDLQSPKRIEMQMKAVKETGYPCSSFTSYLNYIVEDNILFEVIADDILPGLLLYKNEGKKYVEDAEKGSDSIFLSNYPGVVVPVDNKPSDYLRIYHGKNLSSKRFILNQYRGDKADLVRGVRLVRDESELPLIESLIGGVK